jgi:general stress protein 26
MSKKVSVTTLALAVGAAIVTTACATWMIFGRKRSLSRCPASRSSGEPAIPTEASKRVKTPFPAEVVQVLNASHICYLSTSNEMGDPHLSLMTFTYHQPDEVLIFSTRKDTKKSSNLLRSGGRVAILVHDFPSEYTGDASSVNNEQLKCTYSITMNGLAHIEEGERADKYRALHLSHNPNRSHCRFLALLYLCRCA